MQKGSQIVYFEREGRENLSEVVRIIKRVLKKREDLRRVKLVIFTAQGEGPALAYNSLAQQYETQIIAVTFPPHFSAKKPDGTQFFPRIPATVKKFFDGVGITVITPPSLPFDPIDGMELHNQQLKIVKDSLSIFGGSLSLCVQAILLACDFGQIEIGELVIGMTGDCAALIVSSSTPKFLSKGEGLAVQEIFCKPKNLTIARPRPAMMPLPKQESLPGTIEGTFAETKQLERKRNE